MKNLFLMLTLFRGDSDDHNFISLLSCPCEKFNGFDWYLLIHCDSLCKSHGWSCFYTLRMIPVFYTFLLLFILQNAAQDSLKEALVLGEFNLGNLFFSYKQFNLGN